MQIAEREKHKTTIKFVKENWIKLQNVAAIQNTSPTAILNSLLEAYVNENLPEEYEKRIQEKVFSELDKHINDELIDAIALKVAFKLGLKDEVKKDVNTIETFAVVENPEKKQVFHTTDTTDTISTDSTTKKKTTKSKDKEAKKAANIAKFKQYKASDNKRSYSDKHVAAVTEKSQTTICRYRNGERGASKEFIETWGHNHDRTGWVKN